MRTNARSGVQRTLGLLTGLLLGALAGCNTGQFGADLNVRPKPIRIKDLASRTLHLPADQPFSLALPSVNRRAGLDGHAEGDAKAHPDGVGVATAHVEHAGSSETLFLIGSAFANEAPAALDLVCRVHAVYEYEAENSPPNMSGDAGAGVRIFARTHGGRLLREVPLLDYTTASGLSQGSADDVRNFTITLGPGETVNLYVAGHAKVDITERRSASVVVRLSKLEFEIVTRLPAAKPAESAPTRPAGDKPSSGPTGSATTGSAPASGGR